MQSLLTQTGQLLLTTGTGLALFLLGMARLESGIRALGLKTFQVWLTRATGSALASVGVGIGVTALLQSSSLVSLLVLAFASAEILPLYNAIGMLIGANLGTTVSGWLVTAIGFKLPLGGLVMPLLGVGAGLQLMAGRSARAGAVGSLVFGIGLVLFGLDTLRGGTEQLTTQLDIGALKGYGVAAYFFAGVIIAALIQSSSATMALTLMALHSDLIDLSAAAAIVIGADLGTTSTTLLASLTGSAIKRQLALAHLSFNVVVDTAALFVLLPLVPLWETWQPNVDPLVMLVGFHSTFNLLGVLVFLPVLGPFSRWVGRRFLTGQSPAAQLLEQPTTVPAIALQGLEQTLTTLLAEYWVLLGHYVCTTLPTTALADPVRDAVALAGMRREDTDARYRLIKTLESAIYAFSLRVARERLSASEQQSLLRQTTLARALAYSAKTFKDIHEDLAEMTQSPQPEVRALFEGHQHQVASTLNGVMSEVMDVATSPPGVALNVANWLARNDQHFTEGSRVVAKLASSNALAGAALSTLMNINRDVHHALKDVVLSAQHATNDAKQAERMTTGATEEIASTPLAP